MVEDWRIPDPAGLTVEETRPIRDRETRECLREGRCAAVV
jgi:hypothetical protein